MIGTPIASNVGSSAAIALAPLSKTAAVAAIWHNLFMMTSDRSLKVLRAASVRAGFDPPDTAPPQSTRWCERDRFAKSVSATAFAPFGAVPADSMTKLSLELLGGFRLQTDAGEPVPLTTRKAQALLAYLALHPGQAHARAKLAALLWGDRGEAQARDSLRQALSLVRKALSGVGVQPLIAHDDSVTLTPTALNVDAIAFEVCELQRR